MKSIDQQITELYLIAERLDKQMKISERDVVLKQMYELMAQRDKKKVLK